MSADLVICPSTISGEIKVSGSKSHTIRAMVIGALAKGDSVIRNPLIAGDTRSCRKALEEMGVDFRETGRNENELRIKGTAGNFVSPGNPIHVGNSGTTLRLLTGAASLSQHNFTFDGDESIRKRPMQPLISSLYDLGVSVCAIDGHPPVSITGPMRGGQTMTDGITSQFLSSLLLTAPLAPEDTEIKVIDLHEKPYVEMTLQWLDRQGIRYENRDFKSFRVLGNQSYSPFTADIPGDFSSASFPAVAAAVTRGSVSLRGLDMGDSQGDKRIFQVLQKMGAEVSTNKDIITVTGRKPKGGTFDLNDIPDSLPALAVSGCAAEGETRLVNVPQARLKESDRIAVMCRELKKMGADIRELDDGLVMRKSRLSGTVVEGYNDHRIVMALSIAGMTASGTTIIKNGADAAGITYPAFVSDFQKLGADIRIKERDD